MIRKLLARLFPPKEQPIPVATVIYPTAEEAAQGSRKVETLLPAWRQQLGLLIVKPDLGAVVRVVDETRDKNGFQLQLKVQDVLVSPDGFDRTQLLSVGCGWNQPYVSLSEDCINATYSFTLYFGDAGVQRARRAPGWFPPPRTDDHKTTILSTMRSAFDEEHFEELRRHFEEGDNGESRSPNP